MIITSSMSAAHALEPPPRRTGTVRIASVDVEWTKNYRVKNGRRPFCYSVAWLDLPTSHTADLADVPFDWTSVYVEEPDETDPLIRHAARAVAVAERTADIVTGHQFCADLSVLEANAPADARPALQRARERWRQRREAVTQDGGRYVDPRYDAGHLLTGTSRRLVDVCTELGLDVTQPELRRTSMPAWHRRWIETGGPEGRERVSVLNLRHSLSTAYVAALNEGLVRRPEPGLNVNRSLALGARGAWAWLDDPTFTTLLEEDP
ncbi:hypothetical protein AB0D49_33750 [Streptomyces sp. NPDC048290]|uniref:hypothetical protein n=1 Tax=Streptomyces sp. NPDC048290 TaxID=3155811 RepID=UPI0034124621